MSPNPHMSQPPPLGGGLCRALDSVSFPHTIDVGCQLYESATVSTYGCQLYESATVSTLKTLNPFHHRALCILVSGAFRSSPVESLYAETGKPSLQHRRDKLCLQMYVQILGMPNSPAYCAITSCDTDHLFASGTLPYMYITNHLVLKFGNLCH